MDAASATRADQWARALTTRSIMKNVSSGMVATSALSARLPPTASVTAVNLSTGNSFGTGIDVWSDHYPVRLPAAVP